MTARPGRGRNSFFAQETFLPDLLQDSSFNLRNLVPNFCIERWMEDKPASVYAMHLPP